MGNHLYCYKMTWDTESAPNPHHGVLTLAICKPTIRRCSQVGDWISGWTAKTVHGKDKLYFFDHRKLIYLARIKEKLTIAQYWDRYSQKRPHVIGYNQDPSIKKTCGGSSKKEENAIFDSGDNIYKPLVDNPVVFGDFEQIKNNNHKEEDKAHDLKGRYVLICEEFYYYGVDNAIDVDKDILNVIVPRCKKLSLSDCMGFIEYIKKDNRATIQGNYENHIEQKRL